MEVHPNIQKLIKGLKHFDIPILSVKDDTYQTAKKLMKTYAKLRVNSLRKIALALGLFNTNVDTKKLTKKIITQQNNKIITPMMFEYKLFSMAHANKKRLFYQKVVMRGFYEQLK